MVLSTSDIHTALSNIEILKGVDIHVRNGQFVGLIGPNGSGKTTFLKSVYKVHKPTRGTVMLDDLDVLHASAKKVAQHMAVVGQFNELAFDFSVYEIVAMGRSPHKSFMESDNDHDAQLVHDALVTVGLEGYAQRSYLSLSGGEKQRVVLARALVQEPKFLVLDEPTNHLDVKYQIQLLGIVRSLGVSTIAALHDLGLAARYCDYLYAMKAGKVVCHGTPEQVITRDLMRELYDVDCRVYRDPFGGHLAIAYL